MTSTALLYPARLFDFIDARPRRTATVVAALVMLLIRMPRTFLSPQLWGEDAVLLSQAHNAGWHSIAETLGGTFALYGRIVAMIATALPLEVLPAAYFIASLSIALLVVFLTTSPRFNIPHRTIAALAIVLVPPGTEVLCALANTQWVLPIGLIVLLFCRASSSRVVLLLEAIYVLVAVGTGPVGVFATPLFFWKAYVTQGNERFRLSIFSAILVVVSVIQVSAAISNLGVFNLVTPRNYSFTLWLSIPLNWLEPLPRIGNTVGYSALGAFVAISIAVVVTSYSFREPYRFQKIAMILFAGAILYSGMFKYRHDLGTGYAFTPRYTYVGSVFVVWFLCIAASTARRELFGVILSVALVNSLIVTVGNDRPRSMNWSEALLHCGGLIPISPPGWYLSAGDPAWSAIVR